MDLGKASCYFTEQEAGHAGHAYLDRPALPPRRRADHVLGRRAHHVLRHDRRAHAHQERRRRAHDGTAWPSSTTRSSRCRHAGHGSAPRRRMNALAHCVEAAYAVAAARRRPRPSPSPAPARIRARCPPWSTSPTTSRPAPSLLAGAALAGRALQNASMGVHHGLAQLLGGADRHPPRTGQRPRAAARHAVQRRRSCPTELAPSPPALGARRRRPTAGARGSARRSGLPRRLRDVGVTEDDLDAVARLSQGSAGRAVATRGR